MINDATQSSKQLREYGLIMGFAITGIFGLYPWMVLKKSFVAWPFYVAGCFWAVSVIAPTLLRPLYRIWMVLGHVLGKINSTLILSLCYFVLFVPVALFFRLTHRDRLNRWSGQSTPTFRKVRSPNADSKGMENPF